VELFFFLIYSFFGIAYDCDMDKRIEVFITLKEAAETLQVSKSTVLKYIRRGSIRAIFDRFPGRYLIETESLKTFAKKRFVELPHDD
jgi:excisionase family DNA binding protein